MAVKGGKTWSARLWEPSREKISSSSASTGTELRLSSRTRSASGATSRSRSGLVSAGTRPGMSPGSRPPPGGSGSGSGSGELLACLEAQDRVDEELDVSDVAPGVSIDVDRLQVPRQAQDEVDAALQVDGVDQTVPRQVATRGCVAGRPAEGDRQPSDERAPGGPPPLVSCVAHGSSFSLVVTVRAPSTDRQGPRPAGHAARLERRRLPVEIKVFGRLGGRRGRISASGRRPARIGGQSCAVEARELPTIETPSSS